MNYWCHACSLMSCKHYDKQLLLPLLLLLLLFCYCYCCHYYYYCAYAVPSSGNQLQWQFASSDLGERLPGTSLYTIHKETQNNHGGCGMPVTTKMAEFLKKMQEMGRSHIGNALGNMCIADNRNNTYKL